MLGTSHGASLFGDVVAVVQIVVFGWGRRGRAQFATDRAGDLMSDESTTVLSVWEPFVDVMARTGLGVGPGVIDFEALDKAYEESARERAAEGRSARRAPV